MRFVTSPVRGVPRPIVRGTLCLACFVLFTCGAPGASPAIPDPGASTLQPSASDTPDPSGTTTGGHVQSTVPNEATVTTGSDPFVVAVPNECDRDADTPGQPEYTRLAELDQRPIENPVPGDGLTSVASTLTNAGGQSFDVIATGAQDGAIAAFIAEASICLEAMPIPELPIVPDPVRLDAIVVDVASDLTEASVAELSQARDDLVTNGQPDSLGDVIGSLGVARADVLAEATIQATADVATAVATGRLSQSEGDGADLGELLGALLSQPGAPFLVGPARLPDDESKYVEVIGNDPEQTVVVTLQSLETGIDGEFQVIWFVIDPFIDAKKWRFYRAKCQYWASVAINASKGSATAFLWGYAPRFDVGSKTGDGGDGWSPWLRSPTSAAKKTFDVSVHGRLNQSYYDLAGGWVEDVGGGCG